LDASVPALDNQAMAITNTIATVRTDLAARRTRRAEARRLEHDLAAYTSPGEMAELDAIIARAPEAEGAYLDRIVTRLRAA